MLRIAPILAVSWALLPATVLAGQLSVSPASVGVSNGGAAAVDLVLAGSEGPVSVFDVTVRYDPAVVGFTGVTFGGPLGNEGLNEVLTYVERTSADSINVVGFSLLSQTALASLQTGPVILATLGFVGIRVGATAVTIDAAGIGDATGNLPAPGTTGASIAVGPGGALSIVASANPSTLAAGQTFTVGGGVGNPGLPGAADFYVGILRPDASIQFFTTTGSALGSLGATDSFVPLATGVALATAFSVNESSFRTLQRSAADVAGSYVFFIMALKAGALSGAGVTSDAVLGVAATPFSFP